MKVKMIESAETACTLEIEVEAAVVSDEYERHFSRQAAQASLPGFRKGKVPRNVLESRIGAAVERDALNELLPRATLEAVREQKLRMVGYPSIEGLEYKKSSPLTFKAKLEIKPLVKLKGGLEGLALKAPKSAVTDAEIEEQVLKLRERAATIGAETGKAAVSGDSLLIDFEGRINGEPFQGGKAEDFNLVLGRKQLIPGFEEGLLGAQKEETRELNVKFPEDYAASDVAGKDAVFTVHVKEIRAIELPELNDDFAKSLGGVDSVDAMKEAIRTTMSATKERTRKGLLQEQVAQELLEKHPMAVPPSMVEQELNVLLDREVSRLRSQGMEPRGDEGLKRLAEEMKPAAEKRARLSLILESLADEKQLNVSEAEFEEDMAKAAPQLGMSLQQTISWVRQNGREASVKARLREEKALNYLIEKAKIQEA